MMKQTLTEKKSEELQTARVLKPSCGSRGIRPFSRMMSELMDAAWVARSIGKEKTAYAIRELALDGQYGQAAQLACGKQVQIPKGILG